MTTVSAAEHESKATHKNEKELCDGLDPIEDFSTGIWTQLVYTWTINVLKLFLSVLVSTKEIRIEPSQTKMLVIAKRGQYQQGNGRSSLITETSQLIFEGLMSEKAKKQKSSFLNCQC